MNRLLICQTPDALQLRANCPIRGPLTVRHIVDCVQIPLPALVKHVLLISSYHLQKVRLGIVESRPLWRAGGEKKETYMYIARSVTYNVLVVLRLPGLRDVSLSTPHQLLGRLSLRVAVSEETSIYRQIVFQLLQRRPREASVVSLHGQHL